MGEPTRKCSVLAKKLLNLTYLVHADQNQSNQADLRVNDLD